MGRKLSQFALAFIALVTMAIPADATALTLKDSSGRVQSGASIIATSTDTLITNTPVGTVECSHVEISTKVQANSGSLITTDSGPGNCQAPGGVLLTELTLAHLETTGNDHGGVALSFELDIGVFDCPYGGTVVFTYSTGLGNDSLRLNGPLTSPFQFCEPEDLVVIFEGLYTVTTTNGSQVWIESGA